LILRFMVYLSVDCGLFAVGPSGYLNENTTCGVEGEISPLLVLIEGIPCAQCGGHHLADLRGDVAPLRAVNQVEKPVPHAHDGLVYGGRIMSRDVGWGGVITNHGDLVASPVTDKWVVSRIPASAPVGTGEEEEEGGGGGSLPPDLFHDLETRADLVRIDVLTLGEVGDVVVLSHAYVVAVLRAGVTSGGAGVTFGGEVFKSNCLRRGLLRTILAEDNAEGSNRRAHPCPVDAPVTGHAGVLPIHPHPHL